MDAIDPRHDEMLLEAAGRGDGSAFAVFYRRHLPAVVAFHFTRVRSPELAADLAAETFAGALLSSRRFSPRAEPALAWLLGIARNKLRESTRRHRVEDGARRRLAMSPLVLEDEALERVEELASVGREALDLLGTLPATLRGAVEARILDERPYQDVAIELRCSEQSCVSE